MIFGELITTRHYSDLYEDLLRFLHEHFPDLQSGLQGDAWFWLFEGDRKVAVDTFSSMHYEIKATEADADFARRVLQFLETKYTVHRIEPPEPEGHED